MRLFVSILFLLLTPSPAFTADGLADLRAGGTSTVAAVVDGDTVILDSPLDGVAQVRLVGIQAPKLALGRKGFQEWPLALEAKAALAAMVLGKAVELRFGGADRDRHGRHLAHLFLGDGTWVQGQLLGSGWARVYTFPDNQALAAEMYAAEDAARSARLGIWGNRFYHLRGAEAGPLYPDIGTFQVIRGTVVAAARVRGGVYLNFGDDWKSDFTVSLEPKARRRFEKAGLDPLTLQGTRIEVRGWLRQRNGPMIAASHRQQVRVLAPP